LLEASEKLNEDTLTEEEKIAYKQFQESRRIERSEIETALKEGEEKGMEKGMEKGIEKGMAVTIEVYKMHQEGNSVDKIAEAVGLSKLEVENIIKNFA